MAFRTWKELQQRRTKTRCDPAVLRKRTVLDHLVSLGIPTLTGLFVAQLLMGQEQSASKAVSAPATTQVTCIASDDASKPIVNARLSWKWSDGKEMTASTDESGHFNVTLPMGADSSFKVDVTGVAPATERAAKAQCFAMPATALDGKRTSSVVPVNGSARSPNNKPVDGAAVSFKDADGQVITVHTNRAGEFQALVPADQDLSITVEAQDYAPASVVRKIQSGDKFAFVLAESRSSHAWLTTQSATLSVITASLLLFWLIAVLARYFCIIQVDRKIAQANINGLEQRVAASTYAAVKARVDALISHANDELKEAQKQVLRTALLGVRGHETAAHMACSNAELIMAECRERDAVLSELRIVEESLRPEYSNLADKVRAVLDSAKDSTTPTLPFLQATLIDALRWANRKRDNANRSVLNWQNKAFVLVFIGCALLSAMTLTFENPTFLWLGFAGGFASRLLRGKTSASDDADLRWTSLFLSPIYGAIAGWGGILILTALKDMKALGDTVITFDWDHAAGSVVAMGLAFVFGFSERFFSAVTEMAEKAVTKAKNATPEDDPAGKNRTRDAQAGIPESHGRAPDKTVEWDAATKTLTIKGSGLDSTKSVEMKPSSGNVVTLTVDPARSSATQLKATASTAPQAGEYRVLVAGQEVTTVKVG